MEFGSGLKKLFNTLTGRGNAQAMQEYYLTLHTDPNFQPVPSPHYKTMQVMMGQAEVFAEKLSDWIVENRAAYQGKWRTVGHTLPKSKFKNALSTDDRPRAVICCTPDMLKDVVAKFGSEIAETKKSVFKVGPFYYYRS